tara:strand:+ start:848 stop:1036 length:189 start_codon:yes stop_codon:yes gene_type:complete
MAKGTAAKSASGAAMSKYDVEVEKRLSALESQSNSGGADFDRLTAIEQRLEEIGAKIKKEWG